MHLISPQHIYLFIPMAKYHCLLLLSLALLMAMAAATQFTVGDSMGWTVPADPNTMSYNSWAEKRRFQIGDSLLFVYPPDRDSVLQVTPDAYSTCNISSYIQRFDDGHTVFTFMQSGPYYFISGNENNCIRNESMVVVVMADRSNRNSSGANAAPPTIAPSPPPTPTVSPPPPLPPSSPSEEVPPASAPSGESSPPPPPNGAALKMVGFMSSVGALFGSLLLIL